MPERHRSWRWPLALTGLFVATFAAAVFLMPREAAEPGVSAAVAAAEMRKHGGKSVPDPVAGQATDRASVRSGEAGQLPRPAVDDGVDRRAIALGKGPDYLPEPNEGKD